MINRALLGCGAVDNLEWYFSDGVTIFGSPAFHSLSRAGTYTIQLITSTTMEEAGQALRRLWSVDRAFRPLPAIGPPRFNPRREKFV